jgi:NHL repeat
MLNIVSSHLVRRLCRLDRNIANVCASIGVICLLVLVIGLGVAGATGTLPFLGSFGSEGSGAGQLFAPRGAAVDGSSGPSRGDVYVADLGNQRIEKFDAVGRFVLMFGREVNQTEHERSLAGGETLREKEAKEDVCTAASSDVCGRGVNGTGGGQFHSPMGVAVDQSNGDVYVVDFSNRRIEKFGPAGEFLLAFGKEVDATTSANICTAASGDTCQAGKEGVEEDEFEWAPAGTFIAVGATGTVYVGDENRIQEFEPTGQGKGQIALPGAGRTTALAVDAGEDLYAVSQALSGVRKYSATGEHEQLAEFDPERESSQLTALAIQPTSGDVYVVDTSEGARIRKYLPEGTLSAESSGPLAESLGIAVNASGTAYAVDKPNDRVLFFGEPPREGNPPPSIDAESTTELGEESATVEAQINPYFLETTYRVQYAPDSGYNPSAPEPERYTGPGHGEAPDQAEVLGGGAVLGDQPARVAIAGLSPGTVYHYRFVAHSSAGTTYYTPDRTFATFQTGGLAGLPDGRVYEQVSPRQKNGNNAGVVGQGEAAGYADASAAGDRVSYFQDGPFGATSSGADEYSVASRDPSSGWETSAALPPEGIANGDILGREAQSFLASADLSRFVFAALGPFTKENSSTAGDENLGLYRASGNSSEPEWLSRPTFPSFSEAKPEPGKIEAPEILPIGGSSPDLGTVYFTYFGTLVPADQSRAPFVAGNGPWGFYEWKEGALTSAGVLPNEPGEPGYEAGKPAESGKPDPYGAVPAVLSHPPTERREAGRIYPFPDPFLNEVSKDGSKAFFVSPEPEHATEAGTPTELYVREQHEHGPATTTLVSRDELNGGMPAPGSGAETAVAPVNTQWAPKAYVYASPDGSRAFFESMDKLTDAGHGGEPIGSGPWTYEFNVSTEKVTYLPGVVGPIAASSQDGSSFIFENTQAGKIELWSGGPAPVEVASFSNPSPPSEPEFEGAAASDGAVFVFDTNTVITRGSQTFNNSAGLEQAYRYEVSSQTLSCVSCAPGGAQQSPVEAGRTGSGVEAGGHPRKARARAIADEGRRVFFATAAKLVSRDVNGVTDVYEWEQAGTGGCRSAEREGGCVYLISSGTSPSPSFYLDNDESGENVFFATKQGLTAGNTEASYDIYDARVNGGFPQAASSTECASGCRTPGGSPVLSAPLTTAFGPSGNLAPPAESQLPPKPTPKPLTRAQKLVKALRACAKKPKRKRASCRKQARRRYGVTARVKRDEPARRRG